MNLLSPSRLDAKYLLNMELSLEIFFRGKICALWFEKMTIWFYESCVVICFAKDFIS